MRGRVSPNDEIEDLAVEMNGLAPYNTVVVRDAAGGDGFQASLPAPPVRRYEIRRLDRYFVPDGAGAFVFVPEGAEVPVVPRSQVAP